MRRALLLSLLILCGFPAAASAESVKLLACVPALEGKDRAATFEARVRPARGSERMQVRFTLQVDKDLLGGWRRVAAAGLDEWLTSDPGVIRYSYAKTVQNLSAPAAYRMVVRFRWLDDEGEVLARSRVTSRVCRQPDMRPDLAAERIEAVEGGHAVTLRNAGRSAAGAFAVTLRVGDEQLQPLTVPGLAAGERTVLTFAGPACARGAALTATVDAEQAVDERDEDDDVLVATCAP
jgi:CARDB